MMRATPAETGPSATGALCVGRLASRSSAPPGLRAEVLDFGARRGRCLPIGAALTAGLGPSAMGGGPAPSAAGAATSVLTACESDETRARRPLGRRVLTGAAPLLRHPPERGAGCRTGRPRQAAPAAIAGANRRRTSRPPLAGAARPPAAEAEADVPGRDPEARPSEHAATELGTARCSGGRNRTWDASCASARCLGVPRRQRRQSLIVRVVRNQHVIGPDALSAEQFPVLGHQLAQPQPAAVDARLDGSQGALRSWPPPRRSPCRRRRTAPPRFAGRPAAGEVRHPDGGTALLCVASAIGLRAASIGQLRLALVGIGQLARRPALLARLRMS